MQTFQDELLQLCGRAHDAADVYRAIEAVHAAGVPSWSLDLMSGLPRVRVVLCVCVCGYVFLHMH
jgi:oxygen-independent coproporphyrinogen-3 oxidase